MNEMLKRMERLFKFDAPGAGGGGAAKTVEEQLTEMRGLITAQAETIKKLSAPAPDPGKDDSLNDKVKKDREDKEKKDAETKGVESALKFTLTSGDFLKENASILPKEAAEIFTKAESEKYDSPVQKASAIRAALIQSFFSVQANLDTLTGSQKSSLEEYLKLTKTGKEERANQIYENIFEPTLGVMKQLKKAEEIGKAKQGLGNDSDAEKQYKEKLVSGSRKHFLGEK